MAESAVRSAVGFLGRLLVEEAQFLYGVEGKLEELRDELVWMQCFLKSADAHQFEDEIIALWVSQIKQSVMAAEDIIEKFVIHVMSRRRGTGLVLKLKRYSLLVCELIDLHKTGSRIDTFRRKISMLTPRLQTYVLKTNFVATAHLRGRAGLIGASHSRTQTPSRLIRVAQETVDSLLSPDGKPLLIMCGMDGLGKTSIAKLVFHHKDTKAHYSGFAWVDISWHFQVQGALQKLVSSWSLRSAEMAAQMTEADLKKEVQEFLLKNRYLVVIDGVQDEKALQALREVFDIPDTSTSNVILTTSNYQVAKAFERDNAVRMLSFLKGFESWELLQETLGFRPENFGNGGNEAIRLGGEMATLCNGVPLAVIVLGGILQKRVTLNEWQDVHGNLTSFFRSGNDRTRSHMDVLYLGYNDLPYHLKTCFLHLANFPSNYEIPVGKLYRMWAAEGLLALDGFSDGASLWDVANYYMNDLAQLGMVEIMKRGSTGRVNSVRVHSLLREVCLEKAVTDNFLYVIDYRGSLINPLSTHIFSSHKRLLRVAVYLGQGAKDNILPDSLNSEAQRYVRSLLIFAGQGFDQGRHQDWIQSICNDFCHLRLLDIEGFCLQGKLTRQVRNLVHLRYLSLKDTKVSELPSSIGNLTFLQILDLRVSPSVSCVRIPNNLRKLEQLMHLFLPSVNYEIIKSKVLRVHTLSSLELLANLEVNKFQPGDLHKLRKLRKISVKDIITKVEILNGIFQSPAVVAGKPFTCYLRLEGNLVSRELSTLSRLGCLKRLNVEGKISIPSEVEIGFPPFLKLLRLVSCKLRSDPMRILGRLCHLKYLFMEQNCYVGDVMDCDSDGFPELRTLHLQGLLNLEVLRGLQCEKLERLVIKNCAKLKWIPDLFWPTELTCSPCLSWIRACGTCICYKRTLSGIAEYDVKFFLGRRHDDRLLKSLLHEDHTKVILWGEGGAGKSTIAKRLYNSADVSLYFDAKAWVHYSRSATTSLSRQMIQRLLKDLAPEKRKQELSRKGLDDLVIELKEIMQQKKCIIVFTDLMNSDLVLLLSVFGDQAFETGSKLLLTINEKPEALSDKDFQFQVEPPSLLSGVDLLVRRLGSFVKEINEETQKMMVKCCSRYPLPIVLLGRLLSVNASTHKLGTITEELHSGKIQPPVSEATSLMYALSYDDLQYDMSRCLLYLANFPFGAEIPTRKLYQMWIGACFFPFRGSTYSIGNLLDKAKIYLKELVERGMVEVVKRGSSSTKMSKCKLHFMLHSLCLAKAKEENLLTIIECQREPAASASNDIAWSFPRQVVVHVNQGDDVIFPAPSSSDNDVVSLLFFPSVNNPECGKENWGWFVKICNRFQHLLVLDLEGMWMTGGTLPEQIESLSGLRYLSLKDTFVSELPPSIAKLVRLETLDLRVMESIIIPDVLGNFMCLCHLYLPRSFHLKSGKLSLHGSAYLSTLVNFSTNKVHLNGASLEILQKISINEMKKGDDYDGCVFESLLSSTSAELTINAEVINEDPTVLSSLQNLMEVRIKGSISDTVRLQPQMLPECLKELTLKDTQLKDDPIPVLENLPALTSLCLDRNSFLGKRMTFSSGGFKRLTRLMFHSLRNLEELDLTEAPDHVRELDLVILDCWRLQYIREVKEDGDEAVTL